MVILMRLQKYMALCGVASRREAERMISAGAVKVNGETVTQMGVTVGDNDVVSVRGEAIRPNLKKHYLLLNKPQGYVTTTRDQFDRPTVVDLIARDLSERIYPVGRLDYDSEGALILTNDGDFANLITHPSKTIPKVYVVTVSGVPGRDTITQLRAGVEIDGRMTARARIELIESFKGSACLKVTITEGRNRQIRKMFEQFGHKVLNLKRVSIGNVNLGNLPMGKWRRLTPAEIASFGNDIKQK